MKIEDIIREHAKENNYSLNERSIASVIAGLERNKEKYGDYYCPCRIEKIKENVCPCAFHKEEIKNQGVCHCRLFFKK